MKQLNILLDIYLVLFSSAIVNVTISANYQKDSLNIVEELIDGNEDDLPSWKIQREVFHDFLCNNENKDPTSECNLHELIIKNMKENGTLIHDLVRKIFTKADLYGARPSENIDPISINETIRNFMFMEIFGTKADFLNFIIDSILNRQTISAIAYNEEIRSKLTTFKVRESNSSLSNDVVSWIMDNLIQPLLPNLKKTPDVFSYDYAFAQAGMAFARSLQWNLASLTEEELIYLSQLVETSSKLDPVNVFKMRIFMFPVLLNYYHKHRDIKEKLKTDLKQGNFDWTTAFYEFFDEMQRMMNSPAIRYFSAISSYRNRTRIATDIIEERCTKNGFYGKVESYKDSGEKYHCIKENTLLHKFLSFLMITRIMTPTWAGKTIKLPDVTELFKKQNRHITDRFKEYEEHLITLALKDDTQVQNDIENQTLHKSEIYTSLTVPSINVRTAPGPVIYKKLMSDKVDIFGFSDMNSTNPADCSKYYAVIRYESSMAFSTYNKNYPTSFYMDVVDSDVTSNVFKDIKIHCIASSILKKSEENETQLATSIASYRANQLFKYLTESGMEETVLEEFTKFVSYLIPFYEGIQKIMGDEITEGQFLLLLDTLAFIPLAGSSIKITYKLFKQFAVPALRLILAKESIFMAFRMGLTAMAAEAQTLLFSRAAFTGIGKEILRAVDPGFELAYGIGKGAASLFRALKNKFPIFLRLANAIDTTAQILKSSRVKNVLLPSLKGSKYISKIAKYAGKNVYVKVRPVIKESKNIMMYGHRYLELPNSKYGELRSIVHHPFQTPVRLSDDFDFRKKGVFLELDVSTGETNGLRLIENEHGKLEYKNIESLCVKRNSRLKRHNPKIVDSSASPSELIIANALSCSVDEARVLLTQYFIETKYARNMVVAAIREERRIPDFMTHLRLRFPELLYGFEIYFPITRNHMITDMQQSLRTIYPSDELKVIGIDIQQALPPLIPLYNWCLKRGEFISFEDYFAIQNFIHTRGLIIGESTNIAKQMRNALRRLTIMQAFRLRRHKIFRVYSLGTIQTSDLFSKLVAGKVVDFPGNYLITTTDVNMLLRNFHLKKKGRTNILYRLDIESDCAVADISNIIQNTVVIHKRYISKITVSSVGDFVFRGFPNLRTVKVVSISHGLIDRGQSVTGLMNEIE